MATDGEEQLEEQTDQSGESQADKEENSSRLDSAKAFFRALHVGGDPASSNFGIGQGGEISSAGSAACPSCQRFEAQVASAEQRAAEAESLYKRMAADFENYRRRIEREREEFQALGIQRTVEALLPALDDMDRAQNNLKVDTPKEKLIESLNLVFVRITRCLEQLGVKQLSVIGEHFDPKYHEPVQAVKTTEFPDGAVAQELRRGYILNDKVIRPALVNVASNTEASESGVPGTDSSESESFGKGSRQEKEITVYDLSEFESSDEDLEEKAESSPTEAP